MDCYMNAKKNEWFERIRCLFFQLGNVLETFYDLMLSLVVVFCVQSRD